MLETCQENLGDATGKGVHGRNVKLCISYLEGERERGREGEIGVLDLVLLGWG